MRPVGGVFEKAYGAKQAGIKTMIIPEENRKDIPPGHLGLSVYPVKTAEEAFSYIFEDGWDEAAMKSKISSDEPRPSEDTGDEKNG